MRLRAGLLPMQTRTYTLRYTCACSNLAQYPIPLGNSSPLRGSLIAFLGDGWETAPGAVSQPSPKNSCEAPQALRDRERAFPNGINIQVTSWDLWPYVDIVCWIRHGSMSAHHPTAFHLDRSPPPQCFQMRTGILHGSFFLGFKIFSFSLTCARLTCA
jgi:hypothetical protein